MPCTDQNLVLRHLLIHAICPRRDSSREVVYLGESRLLKERYGFGAAAAHFAVGDDLAAGVEFAHPLRQIVERDQMSVEVADLVFVRLAHAENEQIFYPTPGG